MKVFRKKTVLLLGAAMVLMAAGTVAADPAEWPGVYLGHVDGLNADGEIPYGATLTFHMRIVGSDAPMMMLNNGFTISSYDLTWTSFTGEFNSAYPLEEWFDFVRVMNFWAGGPPEDSVLVGLLALFGPGLPAGFDGELYSFTVGSIEGPPGGIITLDSSWMPPGNPWIWPEFPPAWGGPYEFMMEGGCSPYTYCEPQPTVLKDFEKVLEIHIMCVDPDDVIWESIQVQGKIPPLDGYPVIEDGHLVIGISVMRFIGFSGFRPISGDIETTYTIEFDLIDGTHLILVGDFSLKVYPGDVTFDGQCDMSDVIFMADYFWRGGEPCYFDGHEVAELMDVDGNGEIDPLDMRKVIELAGL